MGNEITIPKFENVDIEDLKENPQNIKQHPEEQIDALVQLIKMQKKFHAPLLIDKNNMIWAGHARILAARRLGMKQVPIVRMENLSKADLKAIMILDNEILKAAYDKKNMGQVLSEIPDFDFKKFHMDFEEFKIVDLPEESEIPEIPKESRAKPGQVYQLGNHRLMCGDATNQNHVEKLLGEDKPNLIFTDPPYDFEKYDYLNYYFENQKDIEILILNGDHGTVNMLENYSKNFIGFYVITFNSPSRFSNQPMISHRLITHYRKGKSKFKNLHDAFGTVQEIVLFKSGLTRHEKPLELSKKFITHYSKENDIVLDLFGSSGSTLVSCEYLGRSCLMMELDPACVDIIIERWETLTHKKAKLTDVH